MNIDNLVTPAFRQVAIKGINKVFYKSDEIGKFNLSFVDEDNKIAFIRNRVCTILWNLLSEANIANHFVKSTGPNEQMVHSLEMLPFFVEGYLLTDEKLSKRLGCSQGIKLKNHLIEVFLKNKENSNPIIGRDHLINFEWVNEKEWDQILNDTKRILDVFQGFFKAFGVSLVSVKVEFGRLYQNGNFLKLMAGDEMSLKNIQVSFDDMLDVGEEDTMLELAKRFDVLKND